MKPLEQIIHDLIANEGPIGLDRYMDLALQHPQHGYYRVREPIGRTGDFITAPEVSQMFGEMIGIWCAESWRQMGKPTPFALVELGPGNGTLMADILRATAKVEGMHAVLHLCLVDSNAALRPRIEDKIAPHRADFFASVEALPAMPMLIVANEFFDAMPVRQFEMTFQGWGERVVTVKDQALAFDLRLLNEDEARKLPEAKPGTVVEVSPVALTLMRQIADRLAEQGGRMLVIDYGYAAPSGSATTQAVSSHTRADFLTRPGEVDLTAHVDFTALAKCAAMSGLAASPLIGQGEYLRNMGIDIRMSQLRQKASPQQAAELDTALARLTAPEQMGVLFKVMEVAAPVGK